MPAIDSLPPADLMGALSAAPKSAAAAFPQTDAGSTSASQFGDVLSQSISSTSASAPQSGQQSPQTAPDNVPSAGRRSDSTPAGNAPINNSPGNNSPDNNTQSQSQAATPAVQPTATSTAQSAAAGPEQPSPDANGAVSDAAGSTVPAGQAALLAASLAAAAYAVRGQAQPIDPSDVTNSNSAKPAPGAAPAQLVNNLLQADNNASGTPANATQTTPGNAGQPGAPQALIASLEQAANQADAQSIPVPALPTPAPDEKAAQVQASIADQQAASATADQGIALPAGPLAASPGTSTGAAANAENLAALLATSKTKTASAENSSGAVADSARPAGDVASTSPAAPAQTADGKTGLSQPLPQPGSALGALAGQQTAGPQAGPAPFAASSFGENSNRPSSASQTASNGSLPALAQLSAPVFSTVAATSSTASFDASNPTQPASTADAAGAMQQTGLQAPGYMFGTAPPSLQLQVTNFSATQMSAPGTLGALVLDQAAYAVQYSHASGQQMQLHLNPPELGALQVDVSMHNGVLTARIEAQTSTAQQILTDNISQLKDSLTQQGVSFDRIDVHLTGSNSGSEGRGMADKSFAQQQDGGLPRDQQFVQPESDDAALRAPNGTVRTSRLPLTSLDIMA